MFHSSRPASPMLLFALLGVVSWVPTAGHAASLAEKDVQVAAKAMGYLEPPIAGGVVAIAYTANNAASRVDADAIAVLFGDGVKAGSTILTAKVVDAAILAGGDYVAVVAAQGVDANQVMAAARTRHILCITGVAEVVQSGSCVMSVKTTPKVQITVNHAAASGTGVAFAIAFRMMIHEI